MELSSNQPTKLNPTPLGPQHYHPASTSDFLSDLFGAPARPYQAIISQQGALPATTVNKDTTSAGTVPSPAQTVTSRYALLPSSPCFFETIYVFLTLLLLLLPRERDTLKTKFKSYKQTLLSLKQRESELLQAKVEPPKIAPLPNDNILKDLERELEETQAKRLQEMQGVEEQIHKDILALGKE